MQNVERIVEQLKRFSNNVISLNSSADLNEILKFEKEFSLQLPSDYKQFILLHNGISLMGVDVYGVGEFSDSETINSLYYFEHNEVNNPMYPSLVPFSPDGYGNHYCFDTATLREDSCDIVFWQYDLSYSEDFLPEKTNNSFLEWVQEVVIDWTTESFDYEGNDK